MKLHVIQNKCVQGTDIDLSHSILFAALFNHDFDADFDERIVKDVSDSRERMSFKICLQKKSCLSFNFLNLFS